MSEEQGKYTGIANPRSMFVEGPFGAGKTSFAIETLFAWLEGGIAPEKILVLVPQRTLSRRYLLALRDSRRGPPGDVEIRTPGGLAKDVSWTKRCRWASSTRSTSRRSRSPARSLTTWARRR